MSACDYFLDRIAATDTPFVITAYERRIRDLDQQNALVSERIAKCGRPPRDFDASLRTALVPRKPL